MQEKTEKARLSASIRWKDANALQPHSNRIANGMRNDAIKGKERKGKKKGISPDGGELDHNGNPKKSTDGMVW